MDDPLDSPPADHGSDRYNYVELSNAPEGVLPPDRLVDHLLDKACQDCNPNLFFRWVPDGESTEGLWSWLDAHGHTWDVTIAHDEGCPTYKRLSNER